MSWSALPISRTTINPRVSLSSVTRSWDFSKLVGSSFLEVHSTRKPTSRHVSSSSCSRTGLSSFSWFSCRELKTCLSATQEWRDWPLKLTAPLPYLQPLPLDKASHWTKLQRILEQLHNFLQSILNHIHHPKSWILYQRRAHNWIR